MVGLFYRRVIAFDMFLRSWALAPHRVTDLRGRQGPATIFPKASRSSVSYASFNRIRVSVCPWFEEVQLVAVVKCFIAGTSQRI